MLYDPNWKDTKVISDAQRVALRAAELIEKYGHVKHDMGALDRGFCLAGALSHATGIVGYRDSWLNIWGPLVEYAKQKGIIESEKHRGQISRGLVEWNNAPERTGEEVIAFLREAANV